MLGKIAQHPSDAIALQSGNTAVSYGDLITNIEILSDMLRQQGWQRIALKGENSIAWVLADLAALNIGAQLVPIPSFFNASQVDHVLLTSGSQVLLDADGKDGSPFGFGLSVTQLGHVEPNALPEGTQKITFTSGSTGSPKGVCLSVQNQTVVANALAERIALHSPRHLCLLPLATLLENIAGVYSPLIAGGTVVLLDDTAKGFTGTQLSNMQQLLTCISEQQPETLILVPELLKVLLMGCKMGWQAPQSLKFIAVGGAKVDGQLLAQARAVGLPVYQGYGLSECASVVALNDNSDKATASVGSVLPHIKYRIENDELIVSGNLFLGYLGAPETWYQTEFATGDLAEEVIEDGETKLAIMGRQKNVVITSFGRNISPEWPESLLDATGLFQQAVVLGDGRAKLVVIAKPFQPLSEEQQTQILAEINRTLPDYAHLGAMVQLTEPLGFEQGLLTANGRPKRDALEIYFKTQLDALFS